MSCLPTMTGRDVTQLVDGIGQYVTDLVARLMSNIDAELVGVR